jgi:hypothetical protein
LQTPNKWSPKAILQKVLGIKFWEVLSTRKPHFNPEFAHVKEYSLGELSKLIAGSSQVAKYRIWYSHYFDTLNSAMVYRSNPKGSVWWLKVYIACVNRFQFLYRGMQAEIKKV